MNAGAQGLLPPAASCESLRMTNETRRTALAAAAIFLIFLVGWNFIPGLVLATAEISPWLGVVVAALFVLTFPAIFWLRSRHNRRIEDKVD